MIDGTLDGGDLTSKSVVFRLNGVNVTLVVFFQLGLVIMDFGVIEIVLSDGGISLSGHVLDCVSQLG